MLLLKSSLVLALCTAVFAANPNPALTAMRTDWDDVAWAGLHAEHRTIWKNLQFSKLIDFLFSEAIASYSAPTSTTKNLTFPSGAWMHISHIESSHLHQFTTFSASCSKSLLGIAVTRLVFFVQVHPWTGKAKEMSVLKTGFRLQTSTTTVTLVQHARNKLKAMIRSLHDTARTLSGAYPCSDEFRTYGGTCNSVRNPDWGTYRKALKRMDSGKLDPAFIPGSNNYPQAGMPNPRTISRKLFRQYESKPSARKMTMLAVYFGQFVDHDLGLTPESGGTVFEEHMDITIEDRNDPLYDIHDGKLDFTRSRGVMDGKKCCGQGIAERFPRAQINVQTSPIDASQVYGCERERVSSLREWRNGKLLAGEVSQKSKEHFLPRNRAEELGIKLENAASDSDDQYAAGDVRANEQPVLNCLHTLFLREHNRIAKVMKKKFPCWKDEKVFQYARKIIAAQLQYFTYQFFLPTILGREHGLPNYSGYKSDVDPTVANIFSTAAYRFGHSAVADSLVVMETGKAFHPRNGIRLHEVFFKPSFVKEVEIEPLLLGSSHQLAETVDTQVVDSLQNNLFKELTGGIDLISLNIQRGRDHGVPKYNDAREMYGLKRKQNFAEVSSNSTVQKILHSLYKSVDNMDCFVGGLAENHLTDSELGELFHTVVREQFTRLRDGDRFYYEALDWPLEVLETEPLQEIIRKSLRLQDIIVRNSGGTLKLSDFNQNVFRM